MASKRPLISRKPSKDVQDISESDTKSYAKLQSVPESSSTDALSNEELDRLSLSVQDKQIIQEARRERKPNKQFRDVKFKPGTTAFDRHNPERSGSFAGFFSLFWLGLFFLWVKTLAEHWRETGHFIRGDLVILYQLDALQLAVTDLIMVSSSVFVVILQYFALKGLSWHRFGWIIQHVWQTSYLAIVVHKSYTNNWQWLQSVFIVLHCVVMLMKQYSYATYMGYLSEVYKARNRLEKKLMKLRSADAPRLKVQPPSPAEEKSKKDASLASDTQGPLETEEEERLLLAEIEELNDELTHDGVTYPENLTLRNYIDYLLVPSLVYDIVYPRTERIRWWYVLEKTLATLGTFGLMTMIAEFYIIAVIPTNLKTMTTNEKLTELPWLMLRVVFPFLVLYLLTFYIIFECICQWFAEITCFADRTFYNDWWNSRSWVRHLIGIIKYGDHN